jgi:DNA-directed RNA polymerase specialized sigma24 family protein
LIYAFLRERHLPVSEYYDIVALGYLQAVQRYLTQPALTRYKFSTIAWSSMRRAETRRKETERRYMDAHRSLGPDPYRDLEFRLFLHDLAAVSSKEQYALARLRLQGYSIAETARAQGMRPKRVRRLLKELFSTYLQLQISKE